MEDLVKNLKAFYNNRTVLVTGHTGFKGTWLARILLMLGAKVVGYSLDAPTVPSMFALTDTGVRIQDRRGDIRDLVHLRSVFDTTKPEVVFHLAAQPIVRYSYDNPAETFEDDVPTVKFNIGSSLSNHDTDVAPCNLQPWFCKKGNVVSPR